MRTVVNWYRPLVQARTWKETAALLALPAVRHRLVHHPRHRAVRLARAC